MPGAAKWKQAEVVDVARSWAEFSALHPDRSWDAYRHRRYELGMGYTPKPADVVDWARRRQRSAKKPAPEPAYPEAVLAPDAARSILRLRDERYLGTFLDFLDAHNDRFPPPGDISVRVNSNVPVGICFMSDWHVGSMGVDHRRLLRDVCQIAEHPRLYCGLGGDNIDNFILAKMMDAARGSLSSIEGQWTLFTTLLLPLLDTGSLLWVSSGNHDQWTRKVAGIDGVLAALKNIPVADDQWGSGAARYTGEGGFIDLHIGPPAGPEQTYVVWRKHRPSRFVSSFNLTHFHKQMTRLQLPRVPDVVVAEHIHTMETGCWYYRGEKKVLINCGSYKVVDSWAREGNYLDGGYGVPVVILYPQKRRMLVVDSIDEALDLLDGLDRVSA